MQRAVILVSGGWKLLGTTIALALVAISVLALITPETGSAATYYLRPNVTIPAASWPWESVGAAEAHQALDDTITESATPSMADYIQTKSNNRESSVGFETHAITGSAVTKAEVWYYAGNSQPFDIRVSGVEQISNSAGWHSLSIPISNQAALDSLTARFHVSGSTSTPRQVLAAFLKIQVSGPHIYWGSWIDGDVYKASFPGVGDAPWDTTTWSLFEAHAGKAVSIVHFGKKPPWNGEPFDPAPLEKSRLSGSLPLMDMGNGMLPGKVQKPNETVKEEEENRISLAEIASGSYDQPFEEWAEDAAAYGYPFFFRWDWEMNGNWFKWGRDAAANPELFVTAWRRLHDMAEAKNATNITWVWCPNTISPSSSTSLAALYPGDEYVDWTCIDGYNRGSSSFVEVFSETYAAITKIASSKPVMIGETASIEGTGTFKATWITNALASLPVTFPKIEAFVWFNWNIVENGKEWTWPIESSSSAQAAFANGISSPFFAGDEFLEPKKLAPISPLP